MFGRATIRLGIGPHSSLIIYVQSRSVYLLYMNMNEWMNGRWLGLACALHCRWKRCKNSRQLVFLFRRSRMSQKRPEGTWRVDSRVLTDMRMLMTAVCGGRRERRQRGRAETTARQARSLRRGCSGQSTNAHTHTHTHTYTIAASDNIDRICLIYSVSTKKRPPKYNGVIFEILGKHHWNFYDGI